MEALLLIDPQNDFCNSEKGALGVPGAEKDCTRITENLMDPDKIDDIFVTMDTHYPFDISHPFFWIDSEGNHPEPLTIIKADDVNKNWHPVIEGHEKWAEYYVSALESQGEYDHIIWPPHCIHGSWGHMIHPTIMEGLIYWANSRKKNFKVIEKGHNPFTEHFGAFEAQVPLDGLGLKQLDGLVDVDVSTMFNDKLHGELAEYDAIHLAGEAESHCVAYTLHQINNTRTNNLNDKLIIHKDCMSPVPGFEGTANPVYETAKEKGSKIIENSTVRGVST